MALQTQYLPKHHHARNGRILHEPIGIKHLFENSDEISGLTCPSRSPLAHLLPAKYVSIAHIRKISTDFSGIQRIFLETGSAPGKTRHRAPFIADTTGPMASLSAAPECQGVWLFAETRDLMKAFGTNEKACRGRRCGRLFRK